MNLRHDVYTTPLQKVPDGLQLEKRFSAPIFQGDGTKRDLLEQVGVENMW